MNGSGTGYVTPSTVTCPSSITSRSADCVLGDVLLISSARKRLHITAPGLYTNLFVALSYIVNPVMSPGNTSGVNCILLFSSPIAFANARAMVVFPTPGTSSMSIFPPAIIDAIILATHMSFPTTTFLLPL